MDKRTSLAEAVSLVTTGSMLAVGGVTLYRRPMAFVRALIQHHQMDAEIADLTLLTFTAGMESDLLVGAGLVKRVRTCYFGLEIFGLAPMFSYYSNRGELDIIEETEASLAFGLRAQLAGVGFMPGRAWLGTDLPRLRPDVKTIVDPYTAETLVAFPALQPDVAVIHALQADYDGNAIIGENRGVDIELSQASSQVIITAEQVVPVLHRADIIALSVSAVVETPIGAAPSSCYPLYSMDGRAILEYTERVVDPGSFWDYLREI